MFLNRSTFNPTSRKQFLYEKDKMREEKTVRDRQKDSSQEQARKGLNVLSVAKASGGSKPFESAHCMCIVNILWGYSSTVKRGKIVHRYNRTEEGTVSSKA